MKTDFKRFSLKSLTENEAKKLGCILLGVLLLLVFVLALFPLLDRGSEKHEATAFAMESFMQQTVYGKDRETAAADAAGAVQLLEQKLSWRMENSDTEKLNRLAGYQWTEISPETMSVLQTAQDVAEKSDGAFDITIAPLSRLWNFGSEAPFVPDAEMIAEMAGNVDHTLLRLDAETCSASLKNLGCAIDLSAIGKGAACDAAVRVYENADVSAAIVSVGSSVGVYGTKAAGTPWSIALKAPVGNEALGTLTIESGFLSTACGSDDCFTENGETYCHILDPATGYPVNNGVISVTVVGAGGALTDALSTACYVLGAEKGTALLAQYGAEGIFVLEDKTVIVTNGLTDRFALTAKDYSLKK